MAPPAIGRAPARSSSRAVLGFPGAVVARRPQLQTLHQLLIQTAHHHARAIGSIRGMTQKRIAVLG